MVYDCPNCLAALRYNPSSGKIECGNCGGSFEVERYQKPVKGGPAMAPKSRTSTKEDSVEDRIQYHIYTCTACGAELAVNGVESSTFCSYCGRPTVVFDRIAEAKKPEYIIPFSVTREQAVAAIRKHLSKGFYVPKGIRNFEVECVRGIYLPYRLYDVGYADKQYLTKGVSIKYYYYRDAEANFHNVPIDASKQLDNDLSWRLEPFDCNGLRFFDVAYLSGFYADCIEVESKQLEPIVLERCKRMFDHEVIKSIEDDENNANSYAIMKNVPDARVLNSATAMFPAWFMTFRYQDEAYTVLVNGQTGKVVGTVPFVKAKLVAMFWIAGIAAAFGFSVFLYFFWAHLMWSLGLLVCAFGFWVHGFSTLKKMKKEVEHLKSSQMNHWVKDRQEEV